MEPFWRAVDHEGEVLEAFVTKRRNRMAALTVLRKAMKRYGRPKTIVTDKLGSYRAALRTIGNGACQETGRWLNNRAENSHQPLRRRERAKPIYDEPAVSLERLKRGEIAASIGVYGNLLAAQIVQLLNIGARQNVGALQLF